MTYAAPAWGFISKSNMNPLQAVQNRTLRLIGGYDKYTRIKQLHSDNEISMLKNYIKVLALKLYTSAKISRNQCIKEFGPDSLVDNQRVPKPSHILR